jgi:RNA polymerase sigma-70 factor (ECF subfamily)
VRVFEGNAGTDNGFRAGSGRRRFERPSGAGTGGSLERQAIERARSGDAGGVRFLYVRYARDVQRYVRSIVRDDYDAEDITQTVFAKLVSALGSYEERAVPFSAWILRIARNAALDSLRQRRAVPYEDVRGPDARYDDSGERSAASLKEALSTLSDEQQQVVLMRHMVGLSPGEIATRLGKSEGSIHGLHHRARANLKEALVMLDAGPSTRATRVPAAVNP